MRHLLKYMKEYRKEAVISPLFKLLEALLELMVPLVMAAIIDKGISGGDTDYVIRMGLLLLLLGLVGLAVAITAQYFAAKVATGFAKKVKQALFAHIQRFTYDQLDTLGTPMLINRLTTDANQVQTGVNMTLRLLLRSPFVVVGAMVMALLVDAKAAMVFIVLIPVLAMVIFSVMGYTLPRYQQVQGMLDRILLRTRETLVGVRVLRAFTKEASEIDHFNCDNVNLMTLQNRVGRISSLMNPLTYALVNAALIALLYSGALRIEGGTLTQGAMVALVNYMAQILVELIKLANLVITITRALASARRISQVLQVNPAMVSGVTLQKSDNDIEEAVRFEHVSMRYAGAAEDALHDITFSVKRAETIGIIGGTGSGKSTLVNLIPRFYEAESGRVLVGGADVKKQSIEALRAVIGMVPQKAVLFTGTIRQNLLWGNESATDEDLWHALDLAQATDIVQEKYGKLDAKIEQGGRNVSGGQRQRLTVARALVRRPSLLILDDSSSALDFATEAALRKALKSLKETTVFIVSQRVSAVRFADLIIVLEDGSLVGKGTHEQLLKDCRVYREIYEMQYPSKEAK